MELSEDTLFEEYMSDTTDDEGAIKFINSPECTIEMINYDNGDGWCALNLAARLNRYEVVEALIKKGADVNHVSWDSSMNPLMYAIYDGDYYEGGSKEANLKTIELLINAGTNLNFEDRFSAFTLACGARKIEVIASLLQHNINVEFKDENGNTGLNMLKKHNNVEGIKLIETYLLNKSLQKELPTNGVEVKKPKI
jgi:ankyrin repeat protein